MLTLHAHEVRQVRHVLIGNVGTVKEGVELRVFGRPESPRLPPVYLRPAQSDPDAPLVRKVCLYQQGIRGELPP